MSQSTKAGEKAWGGGAAVISFRVNVWGLTDRANTPPGPLPLLKSRGDPSQIMER